MMGGNHRKETSSDPSILVVKVYDKIAEEYTKLYFEDRSDDEIIDRFLRLLPQGAKILDMGCGPGSDVKYFIERGFKAEGIDLSIKMINIAKKLVPKGKFKVMDMRELSYPDESFDAIFAAYSLIHIPKKDVERVLKNFYRILKPKGFLYLALQEGRGEKFINEPLKEDEKIFVNFFTESEIRTYLLSVGFRIVKVERRRKKQKGELSSNKLFVIAQKL